MVTAGFVLRVKGDVR